MCMFRDMLWTMVVQAPLLHRLFRSWSLAVCLLMARGCMHAHGARIAAKHANSTITTNACILVRSRSSAMSARMLQAELVI